MELHRRRQEGVGDGAVQLDHRVRDFPAVFGDVGVERREMALDDLREHRANDVFARHLHRERHEVPLHARRDVERTGGGVHARHVLRVLDLLQHDLVLVVPAVVVHELPRELDG